MTIDIRSIAAAAVAKGFALTNAPQSVVIRRVIPGGYNPSTGQTTAASSTDYDCTAIVADYDQHDVDGSTILSTDRRAIIQQADLSITPTTSDKAVIGGRVLGIINVGADAVDATWQLQVRG
jgi:hypothetical protein